MDAPQIRRLYLDYFKSQKHQPIPRASLVPQDDPTTLFTGSGMQPLVPYLLGAPHPAGARLVNSQPCLRAEDIPEVGDNRHTTFFEMLGNWSLGDYFKAEQIPWLWQFLVGQVGLDPHKLYVTCFDGDPQYGIARDEESAKIWQELFAKSDIQAKSAIIGDPKKGYRRGIKPDERIFYYDASKNWWSRAGWPADMPPGEPGGPDSEVFYLFESVSHDPAYGQYCHPNCDCGRFMEIGNSVFMQFVKEADGRFRELPKKNVDFGGGLERIAAASADDPDMFKISLIAPIIGHLDQLSGTTYQQHPEAKRIIADHLRAAVWLAADGVVASNKQQGYVLRRMLRRAVLRAHELNIAQDLMPAVVPIVVGLYADDYPEIAAARPVIEAVLIREEKVFRQTLRKGVRIFADAVGRQLDGATIFQLYDTYGFPTELALEEAGNRGIAISDDWQKQFETLMQEQKERSRTATKGQFKGGLGGHSRRHQRLHTATHLLYAVLRSELGDHVIQKGANITEERLRFDFAHHEKLSPQQLKKIEDRVNSIIKQGLPVRCRELPAKEALAGGAAGQFGDRYGDVVKVYSVGEGGQRLSYEICGGPHVDNTAELAEDGQRFKILKEESSAAGVRRIKATLL